MQSLLTVRQVADLLQISPSTVYSWAEGGRIPCYKLNGSIRFKEEEIENWIEEGKKQPEDVNGKVNKILCRGKTMDIDKIIRRAIDSTKQS